MPVKLRLAIAGVVGVAVVVALPVFILVFEYWQVPAPIAIGLATVEILLFCIASVVYARLTVSPRLPSTVALRSIVLLWSLPLGILAAIVAHYVADLPLAAACGGALAIAAIQTARLARVTEKGMRPRWSLPVALRSPAEAEKAIPIYRHQLGPKKIAAPGQEGLEINLASALIARAREAAAPEGLDEAFAILTRLAARPDVPQATVFRTASELASARDFLAARAGDDTGYRESVDLLQRHALKAADRDRDWQQRDAADAVVQYSTWRLAQLLAASQPDAAAIDAVLASGEQAAQTALRRCHPGTPYELYLQSRYALLLEYTDPARAAEMLRSAIRRSNRKQREERPFAWHSLAGLLLRETGGSPEQRRAHLLEADDLCARTMAASIDILPIAALQRAQIRAEYCRLFPGLDPGRDMSPARYFRRAVDEAMKTSVLLASRYARQWSEWAIAAEQPEEAAEANWRQVIAVPHELEYRYLPEEARRLVTATQGTAAEAGYWLASAGRLQEAATAVELARTLLFAQRVGRFSPLIREELLDAGHAELWARYQRTAARLNELEQRPTSILDAAAAERGPLPIHAAWSDFRRAEQDVAAALGRPASLADTTFAEIVAAAGRGTTIYVLATRFGGRALRVDGSRRVTSVDLPRLTDRLVAALRVELADLTHSDVLSAAEDAWTSVLKQLGRVLMEPLLDDVPRQSVVTLIPVGAVGLLPLHAALVRENGSADAPPRLHHAVDLVYLRYAPSSRLLAPERRSPPGDERVLAADVAAAVGNRVALPEARAETTAIKELYGPSCRLVHDAHRPQVLARMDVTQIWHFACHAATDPRAPLRSALHLADGPLTLADIIRLDRESHELVVLSACETAVPDSTVLDEVISFPGALLAAGVRGVVASNWEVDSKAALALSVRFHQLRQRGLTTTEAFTQAQRWLRTATRRDLYAACPAPFSPPPHLPEGPVRDAWLDSPPPHRHPAAWAAFSLTGV